MKQHRTERLAVCHAGRLPCSRALLHLDSPQCQLDHDRLVGAWSSSAVLTPPDSIPRLMRTCGDHHSAFRASPFCDLIPLTVRVVAAFITSSSCRGESLAIHAFRTAALLPTNGNRSLSRVRPTPPRPLPLHPPGVQRGTALIKSTYSGSTQTDLAADSAFCW
jgi:hypothetical protein